MPPETLGKTNYQKLTEVVPNFRRELLRAKENPAAGIPLRMEPGLNMHYLEGRDNSEHLIGLAEVSMKEDRMIMEQTFILAVNTEEKTLEVMQSISPRASFPAYVQHEDGTQAPAPLHKYLNEYLEMKLDHYIASRQQITFSEPEFPEHDQQQAPEGSDELADELEKLRKRSFGKSNDLDIIH